MDNNKKKAKKYIFWIVAGIIAVLFVILPFALEKTGGANGTASIIYGTAERGSISKTLSGAGTITSEKSIKVTVPDGVEITGYIVSDGDNVSKGDPIAYVNKVTVLKAALELNDTIKDLESDMHHAEDDLVSGYIYSSSSGTVKKIFASVGDDVRQVMLEHGCLAVISLDNGDELKVTGISGTVSGVSITEGRSVYDGATMFTLKGLDGTGEYTNLALKHEKYQDLMAQLYQMYSDGYVAATAGGMIGDVDRTIVKTASSDRPVYATLLSSVVLLGADRSDTDPVSDYVSGTITSIDSVFQANISGVPGTHDLSGFSSQNPRPGDTVFFRRDTYNFDDGTQESDYTVLLISPSGNTPGGNTPGGGAPGGGTSGGGMSGGGMSGGKTGGGGIPAGNGAQTAQEDTPFPLEGTQVATVTPTDKVTVSITVDELDILSIHTGDSARVTIDALPGKSFEGTVTGVNTESSSDSTGSGNRKYYAEITLDRTDEMLDGMNASGLITVDTIDNIVIIPERALVEDGTKTVVYTGKDKNGELINPVAVETGASDGENVQILSGLKEGDSFWYSYNDKVEIGGKDARSSSLFGNSGRPGGGRR